MKKCFVSGLIILFPLVITVAIVIFVINFLTKPFVGIANSLLGHYNLVEDGFLFLSPDTVQTYGTQFLVLLFLFLFTLFLGLLGRLFLFHYLFHFGEYALHRIPIINVIYKTSKELISTVFSPKKQAFKQVVLIPFPSKESYSIGFITRDSLPGFLDEEYVSTFVPTTPNPTSGYLLMVKRRDLILLNITVEEALKYVISCGVVYPETQSNAVPEAAIKKFEPLSH